MPVTVDVVVPAWLLTTTGSRFEPGAWRVAGVPLVGLGAVLLVDSVFLRFAREGGGTLAPVDPPQLVVRGGAYRFVRNPMYLANVAIIAGTSLVTGSWAVLAWGATMLGVFHVFVVAYEEPDLRRRFGTEYEAVVDRTGRWLPRRVRRAGDRRLRRAAGASAARTRPR
jgi:protein-S-isoprenylcysteine O-methyltransferase Ste14